MFIFTSRIVNTFWVVISVGISKQMPFAWVALAGFSSRLNVYGQVVNR